MGLSVIERLRGATRNTAAHIVVGSLVAGLLTLAATLPVVPVLGTLGGSWGEELFGGLGVPLGIALTFLLLPMASFTAGGAVGGSIAWLLGRLIRGV